MRLGALCSLIGTQKFRNLISPGHFRLNPTLSEPAHIGALFGISQ